MGCSIGTLSDGFIVCVRDDVDSCSSRQVYVFGVRRIGCGANSPDLNKLFE